MANVTVYLPSEVEKKARKAARKAGQSLSRWVSDQIARAVDDKWSPEFLALAGAFPDFPDLHELRNGYGKDAPRESID